MSSTVLVFDNDETTGYYVHLMTYINYALRCCVLTAEQEIPMLQTVVAVCKDVGIFRPGTDTFLQSVVARKKAGVIQAVVMYTNAYANPDMNWMSKTWGSVNWVHFIAKVLGLLAGDITLFDVILSRPPHLLHVPYPKKNFGRILEALPASVSRDGLRMIFFDDKPTEILGTTELLTTWHAPEYKCPLSTAAIEPALQRLIPADMMFVTPTITHATILRDIVNFSVASLDNTIQQRHVAAGPWCGFDMDTVLPLPAPPAEVPKLVTDLPVPSAPPSSPCLPRTKSRRFVLEVHIHVHHHYRSRHRHYHHRNLLNRSSSHPHTGR